MWVTLPETNIAPENRPSQKETSIPTIIFQVQTFGFRLGNIWSKQLNHEKKNLLLSMILVV